jgi:hypothetical membrane protein
VTAPAAVRRPLDTTRALLTCGVVAGPLFVATFLVEGAVRADYSPLRHPVSSLELGPGGWVQRLNFVVAGLLYVAFATGLLRTCRGGAGTSRWGSLLVGAHGVGLIGAGVFVTDPVSGYPRGTPDRPDAYTTGGAWHDGLSVLTFLGIPLAAALFAVWFARRGERAWAAYSAVTAVLFLGAFVLASAAFSQSPGLVDRGGLYQRSAIILGLAWLTLLAVRALHPTPDPAPDLARRG